MVEPKPLRLKVQKSAPYERHAPAALRPVARVLVDTGVLHLDQPFDYLVSEKLDAQAQPGHLVAISFNGREVQGYILDRQELGDVKQSSLKYIDRVLSARPLLLPEQYQLFLALSHRYAASIWSFISAAIPPRSASAEKGLVEIKPFIPVAAPASTIKEAFTLPLNQNRWQKIVQVVAERVESGQVLFIVPEESDLEVFTALLEPIYGTDLIVQSSARTPSQRYRNYLAIAAGEPTVILATRSGLFSPLRDGSTIIIFEEPSPSHYEKRYPGWNARDVALLRTNHNLIFMGDSWSMELSRLIQLGFVSHTLSQQANSRSYSFAQSRDSHLAVISRNLRKGSVLISLANPSPLVGLACRRCRNRALCECGGVLISKSGNRITCSLCDRTYLPWKCQHCSHPETVSIKKDPASLAESLSRAFPGHRVLLSHASHRLTEIEDTDALVIATIGHEPAGNYEAVILLDGEFLINRPGLRTEESMLAHWLSLIALAKMDGEVFLSLPQSHPVAIAIASEQPDRFLVETLSDRADVQLPPFYRFALVEVENKDLALFTQAAVESAIFSMITPIALDALHTRVILRARVEQSSDFSEFFLSLLRYRSLKGLTSISVRIDPFSF